MRCLEPDWTNHNNCYFDKMLPKFAQFFFQTVLGQFCKCQGRSCFFSQHMVIKLIVSGWTEQRDLLFHWHLDIVKLYHLLQSICYITSLVSKIMKFIIQLIDDIIYNALTLHTHFSQKYWIDYSRYKYLIFCSATQNIH